MKAIVIYHKDCTDGFTAAWLMRRWAQDQDFVGVRYHPASYGSDVPRIEEGECCYIVDFSYPRAILEQLNQRCSQLQVFDHHRTAEADLKGLGFCTFDMNKSGSLLVWDEFFGGEIPKLVQYVNDRDLWKWALPMSKEINAMLRSYTFDFDTWGLLEDYLDDQFDNAVIQGKAILRDQSQHIDTAVGNASDRSFRYMDNSTPRAKIFRCVSISDKRISSEVAQKIAEQSSHGIGAIDFFGEISLRSLRPDGPDVSEIARKFGGGGHKHAAGFKCL